MNLNPLNFSAPPPPGRGLLPRGAGGGLRPLGPVAWGPKLEKSWEGCNFFFPRDPADPALCLCFWVAGNAAKGWVLCQKPGAIFLVPIRGEEFLRCFGCTKEPEKTRPSYLQKKAQTAAHSRKHISAVWSPPSMGGFSGGNSPLLPFPAAAEKGNFRVVPAAKKKKRRTRVFEGSTNHPIAGPGWDFFYLSETCTRFSGTISSGAKSPPRQQKKGIAGRRGAGDRPKHRGMWFFFSFSIPPQVFSPIVAKEFFPFLPALVPDMWGRKLLGRKKRALRRDCGKLGEVLPPFQTPTGAGGASDAEKPAWRKKKKNAGEGGCRGSSVSGPAQGGNTRGTARRNRKSLLPSRRKKRLPRFSLRRSGGSIFPPQTHRTWEGRGQAPGHGRWLWPGGAKTRGFIFGLGFPGDGGIGGHDESISCPGCSFYPGGRSFT